MSRYIAIDIDASGLYVVAGFARGNSVRVEHAVPILDDPRPLTPDSAPELAKRLKDALATARVAPAPVLVCVGRDRVVMKDVRHPPSGPAEEPAVVRFQAQRDLAEPAENLFLDYVPLPHPAGGDRRATAVFVKKDLFNAARSLCELAGLKLAGFTPRPYAAAAVVRRAIAASTVPSPENPAAPIGVLSLWDGGGEFVVYHGEHLVFSRSVSAMALQSEAGLVGEAKRGLAAFAAQSPKDRLDAVYLCEGHTGGGSWGARLQQSLPLPVHSFDPLLDSPSVADVPTSLRGRFAAAVGLLAARGHGQLPINFVTPRQPKAAPNKSRTWAMLGVLALLVVGVGVAGVMYFLNRDLDRRLAAARARAKTAEEDKKIAEKQVAKLKALDDFRTREVNWLDLLYDFTATAPDVNKVRVRSLEGKLVPPKPEVKSAIAAPPPGTSAVGLRSPSPPPAPVKKTQEPIGTLVLDLVSASEAEDPLVRKWVDDLFAADSKYFVRPTLSWPSSTTGKRQADVKVELLPRRPQDYTRKLVAEFPKTPPPADPQPPVLPFDEGDLQ